MGKGENMTKILYIKIKKNKRLTRTIRSIAGEGLSWERTLGATALVLQLAGSLCGRETRRFLLKQWFQCCYSSRRTQQGRPSPPQPPGQCLTSLRVLTSHHSSIHAAPLSLKTPCLVSMDPILPPRTKPDRWDFAQ